MYESRAYDNEHGNPVVVLVTTGTHDVSRLVQLLQGRLPLTEHIGVADRILRQVKRHNGGRAALALLKAHGGQDFTGDTDVVWWVTDGTYDHPELYGAQGAAREAAIARYQLDNPDRQGAAFTWRRESDVPADKARELVSDGRPTGLIVAPVTVRVPVPQPQPAAAQ